MDKYVHILNKGVDEWNKWRKKNPNISPNFEGLILPKINLYYRADLSNLNFENCDLSDANLDGAYLENSKFNNSSLKGASFRKAYCLNTDFSNSDLSNTNFHRAFLKNANMQNCNLNNSNFEIRNANNLNLTGASLKNITYTDHEVYLRELGTMSMLDLAFAKGLDQVHPDSQDVVLDYLKAVFD